MLIFGIGGSSIRRQVSQDQVVLLAYRYFHIFWLFSVVVSRRYLLASLTEQGWAQRPLTNDEAGQLLGTQPLRPPFWRQWSLVVLLGVILVVILAQSLGRH